MPNEHQQPFNVLQLDENMKVEGNSGGFEWYSPLEAPFQIAGFAWLQEDHVYRRLPLQPDFPIREAVDTLANCTSGGQIRFRTNSSKVSVRIRLTNKTGMYHMAPTGEGGVDAYIGAVGEQIYAGTAGFVPTNQEYEGKLFADLPRELRQVTLNLPLYQGVTECWVGVEPGATIESPIPYESEQRVIVYGTSITQGGCATRPGMTYTNILSRRLNLEFINLGFSGNGKGEPEMAQVIAQISNPACLILDYEANTDTELYTTTLPPFIQFYREQHPHVPILIISRVPYGLEPLYPEFAEGRMERRKFQSELVHSLREAGDSQIYFVDGSNLLGPNPADATVDGVHPTDLGFMYMADGLEPILKQIL